MKKQYLITIIVAIVVAAGGFTGGLFYQKSKDSLAGLSGQNLMTKMQSLGMSGNGFGGENGTPNTNGGNFSFSGGANGRRFGGGGMVNGQIVSLDSQSITVKQQDGSTKTVYYSSSTAISKNTVGSTSDLTVGTEVSTNGTANSDSSVTASDIRINPVGLNTNAAPTQ